MGRRSSYSNSRSRSRSSEKSKRRKRRGYDNSNSPDRNRRGRFKRGGRFGKGRYSEESNDEIREKRRKQENLAKLRALEYDEQWEAEQELLKKSNQGNNHSDRNQQSGEGRIVSAGVKGQKNTASVKDQQVKVDEDDTTQVIGQSKSIEFEYKYLPDENEDGSQEENKPLLTEDEIIQARMALKRDWKKKKIANDSDRSQSSDDDEVGGVFKAASSIETEKTRVANTFGIPISIQLQAEEEINMEQEKIKEAEEKGEDPFEAYMKNIEKKAVKQEKFDLLHHLKKQTKNEEPEVVTKDLVAKFEDIQPQTNEEEQTRVSTAKEEEEDPTKDDEEFIEALKNIDKLKEKETNIDPEDDKKSQIVSASGGSVFDDDDDSMDDETPVDYFARKEKLAQKKHLKPVDHTQIQYEPFRKNLYIECEEITLKSEADIEYFRKELGDIKVRGADCPRPIQNWFHCGLSDKILNVLTDKLKFQHPFPIQCQAIPAIMSGRDCIGIAETGSGKTLAFLLPMLRHIMDQRPLAEGDGPIGIVMVPARELALQVYNDARNFCKALGINIVCIYGGAGVAGQLSELKRGCEIVICTPGRLIDVLTTSNGKITNLKRVTYVVIDEADRMFDLGFEPQISRILVNIRPDRQTVMFSATFPRNVETLAKKILAQPIEIVVGNRGQVGRNILQIVEVVEPEKKKIRLLEVLGYWSTKGQILIFVDKQVEADNLFTDLLQYGYSPLVLHGGQDQVDRQFTIADFKRGVKNIMIATSLAARGLDIKNLVLVVNYNCPTHKEDYTHRIGRTGRAGRKGTAITYITPEEDKYAGDIIQALQLSSVDPPEDLKRLHERFMVKVRRGEAKEIRNRNVQGSGYRFTADEITKMIDFKNTIKNQFGIDLGNFDDNMSTSSKGALTVVSVRGGPDDEKKGPRGDPKDPNNLFKDKKTKDAIRKAATRAATQAIQSGASGEEVIHAALSAIKEIMQRLKEGEVLGKDTDMGALYRARDEMLEKEAGATGTVNQFEINDYPESTRRKVMEKDFLDMIGSLTQSRLSVRGVFIEPGRRPLIGQKKLHVHIEADDHFAAHSAAEEIKKFCEQDAINSLSTAAGYTGYTSKY